MSKVKWLSVVFLSVFAMVVAVSSASATDYTIRWFNNMNYASSVGNPDGYCTNLKADFLNAKGQSLGGAQYSGNVNVQKDTTITVSIPPAATCASMKLSGTCTYKYSRDPVTTASTSINVTGCSSGKAVFLIHNFGMMFYAGQQ